MKEKNNKGSGGKMLAAGVGVAAIGAGMYYLLGPNGKTNQKKAKVLLEKMKKEVARDIKKVKVLSAPIYNKTVDVISENYAKQYKLHEKDISAITKKLKSEWREISAKMAKQAKSSAKSKKA